MKAKTRGEAAIRDDSVLNKTRKSWTEWFQILDNWGAKEKGHKLTARYLAEEWQVSPWWSQSVTIRYEQERGRRAPGQRSGGKFAVSVQRTARASAQQAYAAFTDAAALGRWFTTSAKVDARVGGSYSTADGDQGKFLVLEHPRRVRFTWEHPQHCPGTLVEVNFSPRPDGRVTVRLEHSGIQDEAGFQDLRKGWTGAMDSLKSYLETGKDIP